MRRSSKLAVLTALLLLGSWWLGQLWPGAIRSSAQDVPSSITFRGNVMGRGPVLFKNAKVDLTGTPRWVESTSDVAAGVRVIEGVSDCPPEWYAEGLPSCRVVAPSALRAEARRIHDVSAAAGASNLRVIRSSQEFAALRCLDAKNQAVPPPTVSISGTVLVRAGSGTENGATPQVPCTELVVLATDAPADFVRAAMISALPQGLSDDARSVLIDSKRWSIKYQSTGLITLQAGFVELKDEVHNGGVAACTLSSGGGYPSLYDLDQFDRNYDLFAGNEMVDCGSQYYKTVLRPLAAEVSFSDTHLTEIGTDDRGFYSATLMGQAGGGIFATARVNFSATGARTRQGAYVTYDSVHHEFPDDGQATVDFNVPVDMVVAALEFNFVNEQYSLTSLGAEPMSPAIRFVTGLTSNSSAYADRWPDGETLYDFSTQLGGHRGLVHQISVFDARDTTIYAFRESDGAMLGSRWGLSENDLSCSSMRVEQDEVQAFETVPDRDNDGSGSSIAYDCNDTVCEQCRRAGIYQDPDQEDKDGRLQTSPFGRAMILMRGQHDRESELAPAPAYQFDLSYRSPLRSCTETKAADTSQASTGTQDGGVDASMADAGNGQSDAGQTVIQNVCSAGGQSQVAGDTVRVVIQNHATGYIGSALIDTTTNEVVTGKVTLRPPNLRIWAERTRKDSDEDTRVGSGGAGLSDDSKLVIYSEWLDWDGSPLPATLPGYTARLTVSTAGGLVGDNGSSPTEQTGSIAVPFAIRPGLHTQVIDLPEGKTVRHMYLHVAGVSPEEGFSSEPASVGPYGSFFTDEVCAWTAPSGSDSTVPPVLKCEPTREHTGKPNAPEYSRPWRLVPFKTPVFDRAATEAALKIKAAQVKANYHSGDPTPVIDNVEKVYNWVYGPEYHFSLLDLEVQTIDLETTVGSDPGSSSTSIESTYSLNTDDTDELTRFGDPRSILVGVGRMAVGALAGSNKKFDANGQSLEDIARNTPWEESYLDALDQLKGEDILALQVWQGGDGANPLLVLDDLPLAVATPRWLVFKKLQHYQGQGEAGGNDAEYHSFEVLSFAVPPAWLHAGSDGNPVYEMRATVRLEDWSKHPIDQGTLLDVSKDEARIPSADVWNFVVSYDMVKKAGTGTPPACDDDPADGKPFYVVLEVTARKSGAATDAAPFAKHVIRFPAKLTDERTGVLLGQDIVNDVTVQDGSLHLTRTDFSIPSAGPALAFTRFYTNTAADGADSTLGPGWSHSLNMQLVPLKHEQWGESAPKWVEDLSKQPRLLLTSQLGAGLPGTPDARKWTSVFVNGTTFTLENNVWKADQGRHGTLQQIPCEPGSQEQCFQYTSKDGTQYTYDYPAFKEDVQPNQWIAVGDPVLGTLLSDPPGKDAGDADASGQSDAGDDASANDTDDAGADASGAHSDAGVIYHGADYLRLTPANNDGDSRCQEPLRRRGDLPGPGSVRLIKDRFGNKLSFENDARGRVKTVTDDAGRTCTFKHEKICALSDEPALSDRIMRGVIRLTKVSCEFADTAPIEVTFSYDSHGMLKRTTRGDAAEGLYRVERFLYEQEAGDQEASGSTLSYGDRNLTTILNHKPGSLSPVPQDPGQGRDEANNGDQVETNFEYFSACDPDFKRPSASEFVRSLKASDVVRQVELPATILSEGQSERPTTKFVVRGLLRDVIRDNLTTTYTLNVWGHPRIIQEPNGRVTTKDWRYEAGGCSPAEKDANLCSETITGSGAALVRAMTYDLNGNITRVKTTRGAEPEVNEYTEWDAKFNVPLSKTDSNSITQSWTINEDTGLVQTHTDGTGQTWSYAYYNEDGKRGLVSSTTAPAPAGTTYFTYDAYGYPATTTEPLDADGNSSTTVTTYDGRGRMIRQLDPRGKMTAFDYYDVLDAPKSVQYPEVDSANSANVRTSTFTDRDLLGNVIREVDRNGLELEYEYTDLGQVSLVRRLGAGTMQEASRSLRYDLRGNLTYEEDWRGAATKHDFDEAARTVTTTNRSHITSIQRFDVFGNVEFSQDFGGYQTNISYDSQQREIHRVTSRVSVTDPVDADDGPTDASDYQRDHYYGLSSETGRGGRTVVTEVAYRAAPGDRPGSAVPSANAIVTETHLDARYQPVLQRSYPDPATPATTVYTYDAAGRLIGTTDPTSITQTIEVDARGRVQSVTRGVGTSAVVTQYNYDAAGNRIDEIVGALRTHTDYDAWNRPISTTLPSKHTITRSFDGAGNLVMEQEAGRQARLWKRDVRGLVEEFTDATGAKWQYSYDENGNRLTETSPSLPEAGFLTTTYAGYDEEDRPSSKTETWPGGSRTWSYAQYDKLGRLRQVVEPEGVTVDYAYNTLSQVTSECLNQMSPALCRRHSYAGDGSTSLTVDRNGNQQTYQYDGAGRVLSVAGPLPNVSVQYGYDLAGRKVFETDLDGNVTALDYDGQGRVIAVHHGDSTLKDQALTGGQLGGTTVARYAYDAAGRRVFEQDANLAWRGDITSQHRVEYKYDADDQRLKATVYPPTEDDGNTFSVNVTYDDKSDDVATVVVAEGVSKSFTYDDEHRALSETLAGETWRYVRNAYGNVYTSQAPGHDTTKKYVYDPAGRLARVEEGSPPIVTTYTLDDRDRVLRTENSAEGPDSAIAWTYDAADRVTSRKVFKAEPTVYEQFTGEGDPQKITNPNHAVSAYTYDVLGRRLTASYTGPISAPVSTVVPNAVTGMAWSYAPGHLSSVTVNRGAAGSETTTYSDFDDFSRPRSVSDRQVTTNYQYDAAGNTTLVQVGSQSTGYGYDARGRLNRVSVNGGPQSTITYLPDGRLDLVTRPDNGTTTQYKYEPSLRLDSIEHAKSDGVFLKVAYDYYTGGNVLSRVVSAGSVVLESFQTSEDSYDELDRLKSFHTTTKIGTENEDLDVTYGFSGYRRAVETTVKNGSQTPVARTYAYQNGLLKSITVAGADGNFAIDYTYDANGNLIKKSKPGEDTLFAWDNLDQLVQVTRGPPGAGVVVGKYAYDSVGWRNYREEAGSKVNSFWADGNLAQDRDATTGAVLAHYYHADGNPFAVDDGDENDVRYYHQDALGTTLALSNDVGAPTAKYQVGPFGDVKSSGGDAALGRFVFTGHEFDSATGLTYARARYYDSETGGFLSQDPLVGADATNPFTFQPYRYAFGNPMRFTDPTGQFELYDQWIRNLQGTRGVINQQGVEEQYASHNCSNAEGGCSGDPLVRGLHDIERGGANFFVGTAELALRALNGATDASVLAAHDLGIYDALSEDLASAEHNQAAFRKGAVSLGSDTMELGHALNGEFGDTVGAIGSGLAQSGTNFANAAFIEGDSGARAAVGEFAAAALVGGPSPGEAFSSVGAGLKASGQIAKSAAKVALRSMAQVATEPLNALRPFGRTLARSAKNAALAPLWLALGAGSAEAGWSGAVEGASEAFIGPREFIGPRLPNGGSSLGASEDALVTNWRGDPVIRYPGHEWSPLDPHISQPPVYEPGPFTAEQREAFLQGTAGDTGLAPHHRHQLPVETHGGMIDDIPGVGHPMGNIHTRNVGGHSRHRGPSYFRHATGGEAQRAREIRNYYRAKGQRLIPFPDDPELYIDPGPQ